MNYTEIKALALSYADREDAEVSDRLDDFISIVESRINRVLGVRKMVTRSQTTTIKDQEYYGLPADFSGIRDIEMFDILAPKSRSTLKYLSPEQMNSIADLSTDFVYYTIIADQFQISPTQDGKILEIVYYQNLPPLTDVSPENWLTFYAPDAYVFGILTEINAFVKDKETANLWDTRFKETIDNLSNKDDTERWSGTAMQTRIG